MKNAKENLKNKKGITLIALVITIIVLLILAGVSIAMLTGDNGILRNVARANEQSEISSEDELRRLTQLEAATHIEEYQYTDVSGVKINIPAKCAVSQVEGENTLEKGLVIIDINGNEWVWIEVPRTEEIYKEAGLEISEFSEDECKKIYADLKNYTKDYSDSVYSDTFFSGCGLDSEGQYENLKNSILKSIYINGGFFIGRYETGIEDGYRNFGSNNEPQSIENYKAVIKANVCPYNYVSCEQAQKLSEGLAVGNKKASLMFGIVYDLVLKFLEDSNALTKDEIKVDSSSFGNYENANFTVFQGKYVVRDRNTNILGNWNSIINSYNKLDIGDNNRVLLTTGATKRNCKMNIYDLAGNVWELTLENSMYEWQPVVPRGGYCGNIGSDYPLAYRYLRPLYFSGDSIGFRTILYNE